MPIHHIHLAAMLNKKRGLEGKFTRQYVELDVTSCVHSSSVNMFKNRIENYLVRAGYT